MRVEGQDGTLHRGVTTAHSCGAHSGYPVSSDRRCAPQHASATGPTLLLSAELYCLSHRTITWTCAPGKPTAGRGHHPPASCHMVSAVAITMPHTSSALRAGY